jgi:hypothetical protein
MKKNNTKLKKRVYEFANRRDNERSKIRNQFGEFANEKLSLAELEGETLGSVLATRAHEQDPLTSVYSFGNVPPPPPPPPSEGALIHQQQQQQQIVDSDDGQDERIKPSDFILSTDKVQPYDDNAL